METNDRLEFLHKKALALTKNPGVYLMKDKQGKIIYIGKAKALSNRVKSYFAPGAAHTGKVAKMVSRVYDFDYIVTDSEFEALVLECNLIKLHSPKYNILLKDDKGYHYIRITKEPYPRIIAAKNNSTNDNHLGPYTSSFTVKQSVDEANRVFMLPTCKRKFPEEFGKKRPCLNYHIKRCAGICRGTMDQKNYNELVKEAVDYIKNGSAQSVKSLTESMEQASEQLDFERAAILRDRIRAIKSAGEKQKIINNRHLNVDVAAGAAGGGNVVFTVLKYRRGALADKETFFITETDSISEARNEFLTRYYSKNVDIPKLICLDEEIPDMALLEEMLRSTSGHAVTISVPVKGELKKLVFMAATNSAEQLSLKVNRTGREIAALSELAKALGLDTPPEYIEAYDISNLGDTGIVAGMVVFENGRPKKSAYKRFSIKDMPMRDDYASMVQVITRRLDRYEAEKDSEEGFGRLPSLILLDGGQGHVSRVQAVLDERGINIPLFGMVKDDKHRTRAIAANGGEISISSLKQAFTLVTEIQNEVHRFSISYQKKVRNKSMFSSNLLSVKGIGEKKAAKLLKEFKTKAGLKSASIEQLAKTAGVSEQTAKELYDVIQKM